MNEFVLLQPQIASLNPKAFKWMRLEYVTLQHDPKYISYVHI